MAGGKTQVFAILGSPVAHSLSPAMHNAAFRVLGLDAVYVALACGVADLESAIRLLTRAGGGGNVTVPHKEAAAALVSHPSERVSQLRACNTFWAEGNDVAGDNTDLEGVLATLDALEAPPTAWLIAGTGGGARAAAAGARERGAAVAIRSRDSDRRRGFEAWARAQGLTFAAARDCEVLVNATPLGLRPGDHLPIALDEAPGAMVAFDMVYAPGETAWVRSMRQSGLRAADGRGMLVAQGGAAFQRWFPGEDAPTEVMRAAVD
ncbi:MAG: shikimate dehydrogenase family protein, partial [Gemmatimonadales bacterium]